MYNQDANGIRYGVIACASLDSELVDTLFHGPQSTDLSYKAAYDEAKAEAGNKADSLEKECAEKAVERLREGGLSDPVGIIAQDTYRDEVEAMYERMGYSDRDDFVDQEMERFSDLCGEINEPTIEGEYEGVKYRISWLGGAPLLWCLESETISRADLCSPCVPNAGSLDSMNPLGYECYDVPQDWRVAHGRDS